MEIRVREKCENCEGKGGGFQAFPTSPFGRCPNCDGEGCIESWVAIPYTLEEFREQLSFLQTGRAIRYELHLREQP